MHQPAPSRQDDDIQKRASAVNSINDIVAPSSKISIRPNLLDAPT